MPTGECPRCGRPVDAGGAKAPVSPAALVTEPVVPAVDDVPIDGDELGPIPWHLKLLAGAVALYLGFRAFQGIEWIVDQF